MSAFAVFRRNRLLILGVGLVAFSVRALHIRALSTAPIFEVLLGDSKRYFEWASDIAAGNWIGTGTFYQAPLYPYLLGLAFTMFGASIDVARALQVLAGTAACVMVAVSGRYFFGWKAGLIAGLMLALYPPAIFFDGHIQKASIDVLLMAAILLGVGAYQSHRPAWALVVIGIALGGLSLNRENARLLFPIVIVWLWRWNHDRAIGSRVRAMAVFSLAVLLLIAPVVMRNYAVSGEAFVSTSQLGPNFYIGNRQGASGVYEPLVPDRGSVVYEQEDAVRLAAMAMGRPPSAAEVSRFWLSRAIDEIRGDKRSWVGLMFRKAALVVNTVEATDTESIEFHATYSPLLRGLLPFTFGVLLPLAVAGMVITARGARGLAVLYALAVVFLGSVVLFFVLARYRHAVVAILALFAGAALACAQWRSFRWQCCS